MIQGDKIPIDFLGIGAPRCGTTWLAACLNEHPQICISKTKECGIFKGKNTLYGEEVFHRNFSYCKNDTLRGTFPVNYLYRDDFAKLLRNHNKNIKIIVMLRNPVDRIHSHLLLWQSLGKIQKHISINKLPYYKNTYPFIESSYYSKYLPIWISEFTRERVFIGIYEDMTENPTKFLKDVYRFLNVDDSFNAPSAHKVINSAMEKRIIRKFVIYITMQLKNTRRKVKKKYLGKNIILAWRKLGLSHLTKKINQKSMMVTPVSIKKKMGPRIPPATRAKLIKLYEEDISYIERITGKKLDSWRTN